MASSSPSKAMRRIQPKAERSPSESDAATERKAGKRRCVSNACVQCRKRKSKCDGGLPSCSTCTAVYKTECAYDSEPGRRAAPKRDSASLQDRNGVADIIVASIRALPESDVADIVQQIRSDEDLEALAESLRKTVTLSHRNEAQTSLTLEHDFSDMIGQGLLANSGHATHFGATSCLGMVKNEDDPPRLSDIPTARALWTDVTNDNQFIQHLLRLYFTWSHPFYSILHVDAFYNDMIIGRNKYCCVLLVNSLCAYACHFSDLPAARTNPDDSRTAGDQFFAEAERLLNNDHTSSLTTVQALAVMSLREASHGRDSTGFQYMGRCIRMAVELGLHLPMTAVNGTVFSPAEVEIRKTTFWGCFVLETAWSMAMGRISSIPRTAISLSKPIAENEAEPSEWTPYTDSSDLIKSGLPIWNGHNTLFLRQVSLLSELVNDMIYMFFAPRERFTSRRLLDMYAKYKSWYKSLPKSMRLQGSPPPHVIILHLYYHTSVLNLFRPLLKWLVKNSEVCPREVCISSANQISTIVKSYYDLYGLRRNCILITHTLLSACTIHLVDLPSETAARHISQDLHYLEEISANHYWAARCFRIIFGLAKKWNISLPDDVPKTSPLILKGDDFSGVPTPDNTSVPILSAYTQPQRGPTAPIDNAPNGHDPLPMRPTTTPQTPNGCTTTAMSPTSQHPTYSNTQSFPASTYTRPPPPPQATMQPNQHNLHHPPSEQLFWAPPIPGTCVPLLGTDMNVSPMDLSSMLVGTSSEWEQFDRDGFRMNDCWGPDAALGGQLDPACGNGYTPGAMAYAGWMTAPPGP